jgi:hypothetical protein
MPILIAQVTRHNVPCDQDSRGNELFSAPVRTAAIAEPGVNLHRAVVKNTPQQ